MNKHLRELLKNTTLNVTYLMVQLIINPLSYSQQKVYERGTFFTKNGI